jgi:hypothetical protein
MSRITPARALWLLLFTGGVVRAGVGDPQVATDHPWYPGELACSTFERLRATQARAFEEVVGHAPVTDEDRALAAWMWRNQHFAHGESGVENLWGGGFQSGDTTTREYWTGLYAHGFALCGTTHAQWTAELNALLGHARSRTVGVTGHNSCEVFLTGGPYGDGRWVLLDHDISTVIYDPAGERLLSIAEIGSDLARLTDPDFTPERQHGWPLGGLHRDDPQAFSAFNVVEHLPGYAGPPPRVHLRRGELLTRYYEPGLHDGNLYLFDDQTFVFWGRNYRAEGIPGPERNRTWVNQPERFRGSPQGTGYHPGQARYGNAVYWYWPNFADGSYREGVVAETADSVTFEFQTPYIIAAEPASDADWGVYEPGCRKGLVVSGESPAPVSVSVDRGATWHAAGELPGTLDLTDSVKGHRQYWLRFDASAASLAESQLKMVTICQANPATFPRLKDEDSLVEFAASHTATISAGPNRAQAEPHIVAGAFDTPRVTLQLEPPRGAPVTHIYAAAHVASSNPPDPAIRYQIDYSLDSGKTWQPVVQDWSVARKGEEPDDFWSQSFCYGDIALDSAHAGPVQVRFHNDGGKRYLRAELHLVYATPPADRCQVEFSWSNDVAGVRTAQQFDPQAPKPWKIPTGRGVRMHSVTMQPVP